MDAIMEPVSDLRDHLGFWLRMVSNHVSFSFAARIDDRGVTVAEWVVLRALYDKAPTAPSRLADELGMSRGAVSKLADRLVAKGHISRCSDDSDRRSQRLALTDAGRRIVPELAMLADANDADVFGRLSTDERRELERLLRLLAERLELSAAPTL